MFVSLFGVILHCTFSQDYHFCPFQVFLSVIVCCGESHCGEYGLAVFLKGSDLSLSMHPMMKRSTAQDFKSHVHTTLTEGLQNTKKCFQLRKVLSVLLQKDTKYVENHYACINTCIKLYREKP